MSCGSREIKVTSFQVASEDLLEEPAELVDPLVEELAPMPVEVDSGTVEVDEENLAFLIGIVGAVGASRASLFIGLDDLSLLPEIFDALEAEVDDDAAFELDEVGCEPSAINSAARALALLEPLEDELDG